MSNKGSLAIARIIVVGEGMVELSRRGDSWSVGHGGDTLNTALHLARFGENVGFLTALGDDPFSDGLHASWVAEGLDSALLLRYRGRRAGLYAITTDRDGERTFTYWRSDSAARCVFSAPGIGDALERAADADLLVFSLISLAILPPEGRTALLDVARHVRARGGRVAFDGNYRPALWRDPNEARIERDRAIACATIGLPTLEDELTLAGTTSAAAVAAHWGDLGAGETVVKMGADGCLVPGNRIVPPATRLRALDTSGAGDAFNAGYLHARLAGVAPEAAAIHGHQLAAWVVMRTGAIPPRDADSPYDDRAVDEGL